jgi:hypothetical protein
VHTTRDIVWLEKLLFDENFNNFDHLQNWNIKVGEGVNNGSYQEIQEIHNNDELVSDDNEVLEEETKDEEVLEEETNEMTEIIPPQPTIRSGRTIQKPERFQTEEGNITIDNEFMCVGAGAMGYIGNTKELHAMKYKEAMKTNNKEKWIIAVNEEHDRMLKYKVWGKQ